MSISINSTANAAATPGSVADAPGMLRRLANSYWGILTFGLFGLVTLWGGVTFTVRTERAAEIENLININENRAHALEEHMRKTLRTADQVLRLLKFNHERGGTPINIQALIGNSLFPRDMLAYLGVFDESGQLLARSDGPLTTNIADQDYFRAHVAADNARLFVSRPMSIRASGMLSIQLSRRINKADGSFGGIVVAATDPANFSRFYDVLDLGPAGAVALIGHDGFVRAHRSEGNTDSGQNIRHDRLFEMLLQHDAGSYRSNAIDGIQRLYSYRSLPQYELIALTGVSEEALLAAFNKRSRTYYAMALVITLGIILLSAALLIMRSREKSTIHVIERHNRELAGLYALVNESNARFERAVSGSAYGIWDWDIAKDIRYFSPRFKALLGYENHALGNSLSDVLPSVHPDDRSKLRSGIVGHLKNRAPLNVSFRVQVKSGEHRWFRIRGEAIWGADGTATHMSGTLADIDEIMRDQEALRASEALLRAVIDNEPECVKLLDRNSNIVQMNPAGLAMLEAETVQQVLNKPVLQFIAPAHHAAFTSLNKAVFRGERGTLEFEVIGLKGTRRRLATHVAPLRNGHDEVYAVLGVTRDVTERRQAENALKVSEERFRQLAENINAVFWIRDPGKNQILYASPAYERIWGRDCASLYKSPRTWLDGIHPDDRDRIAEAAATKQAISEYNEIFRVVQPDGTLRWIRDRAYPVRNASGDVYRIVGISEDITESKRYQEELLHRTNHDTLTELANRNLFSDRLRRAMSEDQRKERLIAVLVVDLDHFKYVNDSLGHVAGDDFLRTVAERLSACIRNEDLVARISADEFAIALFDPESEDAVFEVIQEIQNSIAKPHLTHGNEIQLTSSIGYSLYPRDGENPEDFIRHADAAMHRAKQKGRNTIQHYDAAISGVVNEKLFIASRLRSALNNGEFVLDYQPQIDLYSGKIVGAEALLRWIHPELGLVSPAKFIPVAEETGLIMPIGDWVLQSACAQNKAWQKAGLPAMAVAVNLSTRQFRVKSLVNSIEHILEKTGLDPLFLELELTESLAMDNIEEFIHSLHMLKSLGISISIDDFGTGYSSLSYLQQFPVDRLKIDQSFVRPISKFQADSAIARTVISLAHNLNFRVIAEGVELEEQVMFLRNHDCHEAQGYYFSRPLSVAAMTDLLAIENPFMDKLGVNPEIALAGKE